jgi:hypothetical protein
MYGTDDKRSTTSAAASAIPSEPGAMFIMDPPVGPIGRCTEFTGRIVSIPPGQKPWLAWRGVGNEWYFKPVDRIDESLERWTMGITIGAKEQQGESFVVVPFLALADMNDFLLYDKSIHADTRNKFFPPGATRFTPVTVIRGADNCPPS